MNVSLVDVFVFFSWFMYLFFRFVSRLLFVYLRMDNRFPLSFKNTVSVFSPFCVWRVCLGVTQRKVLVKLR